jgi:hypothetical protein
LICNKKWNYLMAVPVLGVFSKPCSNRRHRPQKSTRPALQAFWLRSPRPPEPLRSALLPGTMTVWKTM